MKLNVLILAAGLGTRMKSSKPKVMHEILGRPIIEYIIDAASKLNPSRIILLTSPSQEEMRKRYAAPGVSMAVQKEQLGTGDAVKSAMEEVEEGADLLVLAGDVPMIKSSTLSSLLKTHEAGKNGITFLSMILDDPKGYGRIKRDRERIEAIVEEKDASEDVRKIKEVNSGIYAFSHDFLKNNIFFLSNENAQKEYYLTDLVKAAYAKNEKTETITIKDAFEVSGINDRKQLSDIEQRMLFDSLSLLMREGVTIRSPQTVYIDSAVKIGRDVEIGSHAVIKGNSVIKDNAVIGDFSYIRNGTIEAGERVKPFSLIDE